MRGYALIRNELNRAFTSIGMAVSLIVGCGLAVHHFVMVLLTSNYMQGFDGYASAYPAMNFAPDFLWMTWLPCDGSLFDGYLLFLLLPLLATLPHAGSMLQDRLHGYTDVVFTRARRGCYYASKWLATFLSGGAVTSVPMVLNFLLLLTIFPVIEPILGSGHVVVERTSTLAELYMLHPLGWTAAWIAIFFVAGGACAIFALAVSCITEHGFVVHILPFLLLYVSSMLLSLLGRDDLGFFTLINPLSSTGGLPALAAELSLLLAAGIVACCVLARRKDAA